jgi:hypothetical protein
MAPKYKSKGFLFKHDNWFDIRIDKGLNKSIDLEKAKERYSKLWDKLKK